MADGVIDLSAMVTVAQACELVGISRRTLYNWMDTGKIRWIRTAGGARRILATSLFRDANGAPLDEAAGV